MKYRKITSRSFHPGWQNEAIRGKSHAQLRYHLQPESTHITSRKLDKAVTEPLRLLMATRLSEEDYVNLLLEECYSRGLLGWLHNTTTADVLAATGSFKSWYIADPFDIHDLVEKTSDQPVVEQKRKARKLEREELLETQYNTHGGPIQALTSHRYLQLGGTSDEWLEIKQKFPNNTLLHWMAALRRLEETGQALDNTSRSLRGARLREHLSEVSRPKKDDRICLIILGDVPQEPGYEGGDGVWDMIVKPVQTPFYINHDTSLTDFQQNIAEFPLIRYHITKHNPKLANCLFVPDDEVHPPGLHAAWDEEGNTLRPERFQKRADLVYDNGPGRGWWSGIIKTSSQHDLTAFRSLDWGALDTEQDWESLLQILKCRQGTRVAYLYHLSVRERIDFVQKQVDEEKRFLEMHQGYKVFNFLLKRHRDEEKSGGLDSLCGNRKDCRMDSAGTMMEIS